MTAAASPVVTRDTILITHANPEDNAFAIWLASRLTMSGYKVWLDVRTLRGGQDFWRIIDEQLRDHAIKQIVLVSAHIGKSGVQKELAMGDARGKKLGDPDFMIPIRLSDVPHGEFPPELIRRNSYDAFPNWASVLQPLLETLIDADVPRGPHFGDGILNDLIAAQEAGRLVVKDQPETLLSNWFELTGNMPMLRLFASGGTASQFESLQKTTGIPLVQHSGLAATFCDPVTFEKAGHNAPALTPRFWIPFNAPSHHSLKCLIVCISFKFIKLFRNHNLLTSVYLDKYPVTLAAFLAKCRRQGRHGYVAPEYCSNAMRASAAYISEGPPPI